MKIQMYIVWQSYPILDKLYADSTSGKLRYAAKQNAKRMASDHESCMEWIRSDKLDHKWEGGAIPFEDKEFVARFETYLLEEKVEFEPYVFSEDLMQFADGITGAQENTIAWLFAENQPKKEEASAEEVEAPPAS
jgi:hypothetical protein